MDCARLRRRTLENSLTAYIDVNVSKLSGGEKPRHQRSKTHKLIAKLICREVDSTVRASTDFIFNHKLIYSMVSSTIRFIIGELDMRV